MLGRLVAFSLLAAFGCVQPGAIVCGEFICAAGSVCKNTPEAEHPPLCVTPQQLTDCKNHDALSDCGQDGRCYQLADDLACLAKGCGNGFVDPSDGEQCDDENHDSLDGCSADCMSDERCGNGVIDPLLGEQCDDANHLSHDACSSNCAVEQASSTDLLPDSPLSYTGHAIAYDQRRGRLILVGGTYSSPIQGGGEIPNDSTWEWDSRAWHRFLSPISPSPRRGAAMTYDHARHVVVLFGGEGDLADTWEWNGNAWRQRDEVGPEGRSDAVMVYDSKTHRVVLFGGTHDGKMVIDGQTWEWDGAGWLAVPAGNLPPSATFPQMAFDERRGVTVLALTTVSGQTLETQMWERTSQAWSRTGTIASGVAALSFDPVLDTILLLDDQQQTATWDGTVIARVGMIPRDPNLRLVSDPVHRKVVGFGGSAFEGGPTLWEWNGANWKPTIVPAIELPGELEGAVATNDALRNVGLLYGSAQLAGQTWTFDGDLWSRAATTGPGPRVDPGLAFRAVGGESFLFGGLVGTQVRGDTWAWNGTAWRNTMAQGPPARRGLAMAYDGARDRVVMFGGSTDTEPRSKAIPSCDCTDARTWEWDGTAWSSSTPVTSPTARRDAAMSYDPVRRKIVLFGGQRGDQAAFANDTWTFDGTWHEEHPLASPPPRMGATLSWDASRQRLVLVGGFVDRIRSQGPFVFTFLESLDDIWEWDGGRWRRLVTTRQPTPRGGHTGMMSPDGAGTIIVGGLSSDEAQASLIREPPQLVRWSAAVGDETCTTRADADGDLLVGCQDPDCWSRCSPLCPPGATGCSSGTPRCGDGICGASETTALCSGDCGPAQATCGDLVCDGNEACAGDCP